MSGATARNVLWAIAGAAAVAEVVVALADLSSVLGAVLFLVMAICGLMPFALAQRRSRVPSIDPTWKAAGGKWTQSLRRTQLASRGARLGDRSGPPGR